MLPALVAIGCIIVSYAEYYGDSIRYHGLMTYARWSSMHGISQLAFAIVVVGGTLAEMCCYPIGLYNVMLQRITPILDNLIAVPSLAISCVSGVAMTKKKFRKKVPLNIERTMQLLLGFGIFWALADRTTQAVESPNGIFALRAIINVISCGLLFAIRYLMFGVSSKSTSTNHNNKSSTIQVKSQAVG